MNSNTLNNHVKYINDRQKEVMVVDVGDGYGSDYWTLAQIIDKEINNKMLSEALKYNRYGNCKFKY